MTARLGAFCTVAAVSTAQDIIQRIRASIPDVNEELLAEETLCMLASVTSMAVTHGAGGDTAVRDSVVQAVSELPHLYRDYLFGVSIMISGDREEFGEEAEAVTVRLGRKQEFYGIHLPHGQFPS